MGDKMFKLGYLLLCEDVGYDKNNNLNYVKNPYDAMVIDEIPTEDFSFHVLLSVFQSIKRVYIVFILSFS